MADQDFRTGGAASAKRAKNLTPSATKLAKPFYYLYVGTGGTVVIKDMGGRTVTYANVPDGGYVLCHGTHLLEATDADDIVGHF